MCIYTVLSIILANKEMQKRSGTKQYQGPINTAIDLYKHKREIIRQISTEDHKNQTFMINQVREIFYALHPTLTLRSLFVVKDEFLPVYKAKSNYVDTHHYEISASVGHDGLTSFAHKLIEKG